MFARLVQALGDGLRHGESKDKGSDVGAGKSADATNPRPKQRGAILNPAWKYTGSDKTDIRKLFKRIIAERKAEAQRPTAAVTPIAAKRGK